MMIIIIKIIINEYRVNRQVDKEAGSGQRTDKRKKPAKSSGTVSSFKQGSCQKYKPGPLV